MRFRNHFIYGILFSFLLFAVFIAIQDPFELLEDTAIESVVRPYLLHILEHQTSSETSANLPKEQQIIYVMGGSEDSLRERLKKASQLYHDDLADKILVFVQPGITSFDRTLNRNLTNEEWTLKQFAQFGIGEKAIGFVDHEEGFWGTLSECRKILEYADRMGVSRLHIVTSIYHTKRTWVTFSSFSSKYNISFSIYGANDVSYLRYLVKEYCKLLIYQYILLPLYK